MKLKTVISPDANEEIIIRCKERNEKVLRLERVIENLINADAETVLRLGETEYFVPYKKILFYEMQDGRLTAHTKERTYTADGTLTKLEEILPHYFVRASKSCIINASLVSSISHNIAGPSKVCFNNTEKFVYASRSYYKFLKERVYAVHGL